MTQLPRGVSRRTLLKASGLATIGIGNGALGSAGAHAQETETEEPTQTGETTTEPQTAGADRSLADQLKAVRAATEQYTELSAAADDGYVSANLPLLCGIGYHFDKESLWEEPPQPEQPGSLVYVVSGEGELVLGAVEYLFVTDRDDEGNPVDPKPDIFNDEDEPADQPPLRGKREADMWELIDDPATGKLVWNLHAWVHIDNPDGVLAHENPDYMELPGCVPLESLL